MRSYVTRVFEEGLLVRAGYARYGAAISGEAWVMPDRPGDFRYSVRLYVCIYRLDQIYESRPNAKEFDTRGQGSSVRS